MMSAASPSQENIAERRINIIQGEHYVSDDRSVVMSTLLGSCVSACMRDPTAGVGGLNHFLLPGNDSSASDGTALRHGVHAMELLVNALLRKGARRERLEAKLFGGANLMRGLTDVGAMNAAFAEDFLKREGISNMGGSLRGDRGRRIQFWPATGRARQVLMAPNQQVPSDIERRARPPLPSASAGAVELF
jgi:chemotaxis protein CheD